MYDCIENNSSFILVYKKPDVDFHDNDELPGLFQTVKQREQLTELYPVHRLDKVTSGLVLMAKTATANRELTHLFSERKIEKYYLAISDKKPNKKQGLIKGDMERSRRGSWKLTSGRQNPAVTQFFSCSMSKGKRLFLVKPLTGKTHQIRVALKSLGAPIMGDRLYGESKPMSLTDRTYLHAYSLAFELAEKSYRFQVWPREGENFLTAEFAAAAEQYTAPNRLCWPKV